MSTREIVTLPYLCKRFGRKAVYDGITCPDKYGFVDVFINGHVYHQFKDLFGICQFIRIK